MKSFKKRLLGMLTACSLSLTGLSAGMFSITANAAQANWKFDFGAGGVSSGFTGVDAGTAYNAQRGYGFAQTGNVNNVSAGGKGPGSDAVEFKSDDKANTFNVDLPKGLYEVTVSIGNAPRCSIRMENMMQIMNLTRLSATETIQLPVTDGQLNIQAVTGIKNGQRSISSVEIRQLNDTGVMNPHVWICGDSTVANYYNQADTAQHGWGQLIGNYLKGTRAEGYVVRNMATSGQYAKGFVDGGQFAPIETYGKAGDFYLISIGINDTNYSNADEYTAVVTDMVQRAKKKGMEVMLVKQQGRHGDLNRNPRLGGRWFGGQLDAIGAAENVKVIDLFTPWQDFGFSIGGYDAMTPYYAADDDLHQSLKGSTKLAELMADLAFNGSSGPVQEQGATLEGEPEFFLLRNGSSGQYLSIVGDIQSGANTVQLASPTLNDKSAFWKAVADGEGSYRIVSMADENLFLDVAGAKAVNGTNVGIWQDSGSDAQLFSFIKQDNGSYVIATKASGGKSAVEVKDASNESGENVQEWERNGHACQTWFLDWADMPKETADILPGDLNGDGEVDVYDEALLKRELAASGHTREMRKKCDVNGDTAADLSDLVMMRDYIHNKGNLSAYSEGKRVYYAADQASARGYYEDTHSAISGEKYLNLDNNINSFTEFKVNAPTDGNYLCTLRVANGSDSNRKMKVVVNDSKDFWVLDFLTTGDWKNWEERAIVLPLAAGVNFIRLASMTADGGPNMDYLRTELTDEPVPDIYTEPEQPEVTTGKTTVYIAGDSTVQTYNQRARDQNGGPIQGWGAFFADYMTDNVTIANHAIAGRSSKSFYDQGRLQSILDVIQKDDYLMIQFAINDSGKSNAERYAPTCGNVDNPSSGSYEWYMTQYIKGAQEKGAIPILVTTTLSAKSYANGKFSTSYDNYRDACKKLASKYKCPCIDLNQLMCDHYNKVGYNTAYSYHMAAVVQGSTDLTHFNDDGAKVVAGLVANAVKGLNIALSAEVK
ncbi:MAG: RICIN domain-containing protein [Oscillospiraceae bacterium]|nr:RICIN domain-containing protein [Oscillospiraceae bacterium]